MAIHPIDLQVLFSRLNQIGREQAVQRDAQIQAQAVAASEIAEQSESRDHRVSELSTEEEGPEVVNEEDEGKQGTGQESRSSNEEEEPTQEVFRDPDLGQHIDISG